MKTNNIFILIGIISITSIVLFGIIITPYSYVFLSNNISKSPQDWGAFGSYVSGLTSILNLVVFFILTFYISNLGDINSDKQIKTQKKIILSQFRQVELNSLIIQFEKFFNLKETELKYEKINLLNSISIFLTNFSTQKNYLFPILKSEIMERNLSILSDLFDDLSSIVEEIHGLEEIEPKKRKVLEEKIRVINILKNDMIEKLQKFIIDDIEN